MTPLRRSLTAVSGVLVALAAACAGSPTAPTDRSTGTAFGGTWQINYSITACSGERHCVLVIGSTRDAQLRLTQSGSQVTGVFAGDVTVDVTGTVAADGTLALAGLMPAQSAQDHEFEFTATGLASTAGALSGSFQYIERGTPQGDFFGTFSRTGRIDTATRTLVTVPTSGFSGTWSGMLGIQSCTFSGWLFCYPHADGSTYPIELTLTQTGGQIAGTLQMGPDVATVRGAASGDTLTLTGAGSRVVGGGANTVQIASFSATRNSVGRLSGSLTFSLAYVRDNAPPSVTDYSAALKTVLLK